MSNNIYLVRPGERETPGNPNLLLETAKVLETATEHEKYCFLLDIPELFIAAGKAKIFIIKTKELRLTDERANEPAQKAQSGLRHFFAKKKSNREILVYDMDSNEPLQASYNKEGAWLEKYRRSQKKEDGLIKLDGTLFKKGDEIIAHSSALQYLYSYLNPNSGNSIQAGTTELGVYRIIRKLLPKSPLQAGVFGLFSAAKAKGAFVDLYSPKIVEKNQPNQNPLLKQLEASHQRQLTAAEKNPIYDCVLPFSNVYIISSYRDDAVYDEIENQAFGVRERYNTYEKVMLEEKNDHSTTTDYDPFAYLGDNTQVKDKTDSSPKSSPKLPKSVQPSTSSADKSNEASANVEQEEKITLPDLSGLQLRNYRPSLKEMRTKKGMATGANYAAVMENK